MSRAMTPSHAYFISPNVLPFFPNSNPPLHPYPQGHRTNLRKRPPYLTICASTEQPYNSRSSSALNQEPTHNSQSYIDLRTMKLIPANEAHLRPSPPSTVTFGVFDNPSVFADQTNLPHLQDLLFTTDTIPLSDTQKQVVQSLLSRRSVLYMSAAGDEKNAIFIDIVMRNRLWKECVVYCAASRRTAEAMYAMLCAQLGPERRAEVCLDLGDSLEQPDNYSNSNHRDGFRVIITSPNVLRSTLVRSHSDSWIAHATLVFIDYFCISSLVQWEEILLAMPTRILMCVFMKEPAAVDKELLPLWLETIQNSVVAISPSGAASLQDRIERPQIFPLLRTFAFNAALHNCPVQVSLTLVMEMLQRERDSTEGDFIPQFAECFLHGIITLPAESPTDLLFASAEEAQYADVASLVVADAKKTGEKIKTRSKKRARPGRRNGRTAASKAAARKRREAALRESLLLPAIVLVSGRNEAEFAAFAIRSALGNDGGLLWDDDSRELLEELVAKYEREYVDQMSGVDVEILRAVLSGVGIIHEGCAPGIRLFVEELYRGNLISVVVADSHLGSTELLGLPCAKSVLIESSALALCDDTDKGLIKASTAAMLAGRVGIDDVGNLIVLWYDDGVDDEAAGNEIASTLLHPLFSSPSESDVDKQTSSPALAEESNFAQIPDVVKQQFKHDLRPSVLSSTYDGVLRSLRKFGMDGFESVLEYTLHSYKGWLSRASLHATIEKMEIEKRAIEEKLDKADNSSIADHERRVAKKNEVMRVFNAMQQRYTAVVTQRAREELQISAPGRIIGVRSSKAAGADAMWYKRLLEGDLKGGKDFTEAADEKDVSTIAVADAESTEKFMAAVFVAVRDQGSDEKRLTLTEHRWLVVCVLADGMWTMLPVSDVLGLGRDDDENVVPNVDLLMVPHPATFDIDPSLEWAKCSAVDETENAALQRISDELIARVASDDQRPVIDRLQIPEFEAQKERLQHVDKLYRQSPWYGREDELLERRRLRRRAAELGDDIAALQEKENTLEERMFSNHNHHLSSQSAVLAVLEDCHAVNVVRDREMEMTPIGALASILPGRFPLFTAACLCLIDDIEKLEIPEFAAFTAIIASGGRMWKAQESHHERREDLGEDGRHGDQDSEELDLSMLRRPVGEMSSSAELELELELEESEARPSVNGLDLLLPSAIATMINEILTALQQLHKRHRLEHGQDDGGEISDIVPTPLNLRLARAVHMFASGTGWREVVKVLYNEEGYGVRELRHVKAVLDVVARGEVEGEFSERVAEIARGAYEALDRWPVRDQEVIVDLVDSGVVRKPWNGNTYEKWWRWARDEIAALNGKGVRVGEDEIAEHAEAEVIE